MKIAIVAVTKKGDKVALKIKRALPGSKLYIPTKFGKRKEAVLFDGKLGDLTEQLFAEFEGIIFCMALGIVVRIIAPYAKNKHTDPAIVVVDDEARFAISALSGHEGGANRLAVRVGNVLGAEPVITTASESGKKTVIGIGCRRGIKKEEIIKAIEYALTAARYSINKVRYIATIDLKQNEPGLKNACLELGIPLRIISSDLIKKFTGSYQRSAFVKQKIGVEGVCEPCALLATKGAKLIVPKKKLGRVTVAVARES